MKVKYLYQTYRDGVFNDSVIDTYKSKSINKICQKVSQKWSNVNMIVTYFQDLLRLRGYEP